MKPWPDSSGAGGVEDEAGGAAPLGQLGVAPAADRELGDLGVEALDVGGDGGGTGAERVEEGGLAGLDASGLGLVEAHEHARLAGRGAGAGGDGDDGGAGEGDLAGPQVDDGDLAVAGGAEGEGLLAQHQQLLLATEHGQLGAQRLGGAFGGVGGDRLAATAGGRDLGDQLGDQGVGDLQLLLEPGVLDGDVVELAAVGHALVDEALQDRELAAEGGEFGGVDGPRGAGGLQGALIGLERLGDLAAGVADAQLGVRGDGAELRLDAPALGGEDLELRAELLRVERGDHLAGAHPLTGAHQHRLDARGLCGRDGVVDRLDEAPGRAAVDPRPQPDRGAHRAQPHRPGEDANAEKSGHLQLHRRLLEQQ